MPFEDMQETERKGVGPQDGLGLPPFDMGDYDRLRDKYYALRIAAKHLRDKYRDLMAFVKSQGKIKQYMDWLEKNPIPADHLTPGS